MISPSDAPDAPRQPCPICGHSVATGEAVVTGDAICLHCGTRLWCAESWVIPIAESPSGMEEIGPCQIPDGIVLGPSLARLITKKAAYQHDVIAVAELPTGIVFAATRPLDKETVEMLRFLVNAPVWLVWADEPWVARQLANQYGTNDRGDEP